METGFTEEVTLEVTFSCWKGGVGVVYWRGVEAEGLVPAQDRGVVYP